MRQRLKMIMVFVYITFIVMGCGLIHEKPFTYTTQSGQELLVTNKNIKSFLRGIQVASSTYQSIQRGFVIAIAQARDAGDEQRVDLIYNRFKPIDDAIKASFTGLAASTSTALILAEDSGDQSVPAILISHAGDITLLLGRLLPLAGEFGIGLPPGFDDVLGIMEVLAR